MAEPEPGGARLLFGRVLQATGVLILCISGPCTAIIAVMWVVAFARGISSDDHLGLAILIGSVFYVLLGWTLFAAGRDLLKQRDPAKKMPFWRRIGILTERIGELSKAIAAPWQVSDWRGALRIAGVIVMAVFGLSFLAIAFVGSLDDPYFWTWIVISFTGTLAGLGIYVAAGSLPG